MKKLAFLATLCLLPATMAQAEVKPPARTTVVKAAATTKAAIKAPAKAAVAKAAVAKAPAKAVQIPLYSIDSGTKKAPPKGSALRSILSGQHLHVCVRADVPPFGSLTSRGLSGMDISLARALVTQLSIDYKKVIHIDWSVINAGARISSLQQKSCDFVAAAFSYTAARAKQIAFTKIYLKTDKVLVAFDKITRKIPVIGLVKGTTGSTAGIKGTVRYFNNYQSIIYAMERGKVDYIITDQPIALHMIRSVTKTYQVVKVLAKGAEKYAIGVNKDNVHLLKALNRALHTIANSGLLAHLQRLWL